MTCLVGSGDSRLAAGSACRVVDSIRGAGHRVAGTARCGPGLCRAPSRGGIPPPPRCTGRGPGGAGPAGDEAACSAAGANPCAQVQGSQVRVPRGRGGPTGRVAAGRPSVRGPRAVAPAARGHDRGRHPLPLAACGAWVQPRWLGLGDSPGGPAVGSPGRGPLWSRLRTQEGALPGRTRLPEPLVAPLPQAKCCLAKTPVWLRHLEEPGTTAQSAGLPPPSRGSWPAWHLLVTARRATWGAQNERVPRCRGPRPPAVPGLRGSGCG